MELLENPEIREAVNCLQESAFSLEELQAYDKYWDSISSERTLLAAAETTGLEKGEAIGIKKGEVIGIKKGEAIGLKKGLRKKAIETAQNLKKLSILSNAQIAEATGLLLEDIEKL